MTAILGISAFYHDSAAALVVDGQIVAAAQEERFTRKKHDAGFPRQARRLLPGRSGPDARPTSTTSAFYDKPLPEVRAAAGDVPRLSRRAGSARSARRCRSGSSRSCTCRGAWPRSSAAATRGRFVFAEHHESHAASAFFPSPFEEAAILTARRRRRVGDRQLRRRPGQPDRADRTSSASRTRSACSTRPSPITRGFRVNSRRIQADGPGPLRRARSTPT